MKSAATEARLFTIGYSNLAGPGLLELLGSVGVTAVADVRSSPFSRWAPHFNGPVLAALLRSAGVAYVYLGNHLGGRPVDQSLYDPDGKGKLVVNYERVRATEPFRQGIERVRRGLERYRVALLCGEEDPLDCHRALMVAPALVEAGLEPFHIRKGGILESQAEFEARLLREVDLLERFGGLFPPSPLEVQELLAEAYRRRGRRVAFRLAG